jgi:hypothetical protein
LNSEWASLNPGFTFCSSVAEQFRFNTKTLSKIKGTSKLPAEFQLPLKRKYFV